MTTQWWKSGTVGPVARPARGPALRALHLDKLPPLAALPDAILMEIFKLLQKITSGKRWPERAVRACVVALGGPFLIQQRFLYVSNERLHPVRSGVMRSMWSVSTVASHRPQPPVRVGAQTTGQRLHAARSSCSGVAEDSDMRKIIAQLSCFTSGALCRGSAL